MKTYCYVYARAYREFGLIHNHNTSLALLSTSFQIDYEHGNKFTFNKHNNITTHSYTHRISSQDLVRILHEADWTLE